ncbi:uncharacterized protein LOC143448632 [Clavelina lepadiformis]|uniref:uncharacterized protein LOC143448632 n=1 Tax=Clavelina lepadiformis TaxID=159417 RepID=UPI004041673F
MDGKDRSYPVVDMDASLKAIRKYRKKLRQIERLEAGGKELTDEEKIKLSSKVDLRARLQGILSSINRKEESFNSTLEVEEESASDEEIMPPSGDMALGDEAKAPTLVTSELKDGDEKSSKELDDEISGESPVKEPPLKKQILSTRIDEKKTMKIYGKEAVKERKDKPRSKLRKLWRNKIYEVTTLDGHNDAICCVDAQNDWIVSGSRDTSVKLWKRSTRSEVRNLSSHSGVVTSISIIDTLESNRLRTLVTSEANELVYDISVKVSEEEHLLITASTDCSIKLWLIPQGYLIKSIYNYSPVTAILRCFNTVFAGSDSGKLTAYDIISGQQICDVIIHNDTVTSIKQNGDQLVTTSIDGELKLWDVYDASSKKISLEKVSGEIEIKMMSSLENYSHYIEGRQILSCCCNDEFVLYGDDGVNIKVINLTTGAISKYSNHKPSAPGFTDCLFISNNLLFSTSYDLDSGQGSLNIRSVKDENAFTYVATFTHSDLTRLTCTMMIERSIITGGSQLLLWEEYVGGKMDFNSSLEDGRIFIKGRNVSEINKISMPSDVESDYTEDETNETGSWWWSKPAETSLKQSQLVDNNDSDSDISQQSIEELPQENGWKTWCSLV